MSWLQRIKSWFRRDKAMPPEAKPDPLAGLPRTPLRPRRRFAAPAPVKVQRRGLKQLSRTPVEVQALALYFALQDRKKRRKQQDWLARHDRTEAEHAALCEARRQAKKAKKAA